ncbi:MAG TPA: hypothetical protein VGX23_34470 [Actinocrinis sp.]|nr:hypothetical protein [Actinocrinis sp.]
MAGTLPASERDTVGRECGWAALANTHAAGRDPDRPTNLSRSVILTPAGR